MWKRLRRRLRGAAGIVGDPEDGGRRRGSDDRQRNIVASFAAVLADLARSGDGLDLREGLDLMTLFAQQESREGPAGSPCLPPGLALEDRFRAFVLHELEWVRCLERALERGQFQEQPASNVEAQLQFLPVDPAERKLLAAVLGTGSLNKASVLCFCSRLALAHRLRPLLQAVSSGPAEPREPPLMARLRHVIHSLHVSEGRGASDE